MFKPGLEFVVCEIRSRKKDQYSTEGQKRHQNLAPVLVIISGKSLVFSMKIITSTGFYRCCAPDASAPVVALNRSPRLDLLTPSRALVIGQSFGHLRSWCFSACFSLWN